MGVQISVEESSILNILMRVLRKRDIKYEERAVRTLLLCCNRNELPATAKTAFDIETWEKAEKELFEAASKGDQVATQSLTMWRLVKDSLSHLRARKKAKATAVSATNPEPSPRPVSPSTFPVPMAPQLPPADGAQQTSGVLWFGCGQQQKCHAATPPPAWVQRSMERNRQKLVGQDKGSLTEQKTKGTVTTTIQIRENTTQTTEPTEPLSQTGPAPRSPEPQMSSCHPAPCPPEPSMMAHGMEYPALFGQVGSAHPAVPLPGFQ